MEERERERERVRFESIMRDKKENGYWTLGERIAWQGCSTRVKWAVDLIVVT